MTGHKMPEVGPVFASLMTSPTADTMAYLLKNCEFEEGELSQANQRMRSVTDGRPLKEVIANWIVFTRTVFFNIQEAGVMKHEPSTTPRNENARHSAEFH